MLEGMFSVPSAAAFFIVCMLMAWFFREAEMIPLPLSIWTGAASCMGLIAGAVSLGKRNYAGAAGMFLVSTMAPMVLYSQFGSFSAEVRLGLGEPSAGYENVRKKQLAKPPGLSMVFEGTRDEKAVLKIDGKEVLLAEGEKARTGGLYLGLREMSFAPAVTIRSGDSTVAEFLLKASRSGNDPPAVFDILPHKFLVRNIDRDTVGLVIARGKLKVCDRVLKSGEQLEFEGMSFVFAPGEPFVILEVAKPFRGKVVGAMLAVAIILLFIGARRDA